MINGCIKRLLMAEYSISDKSFQASMAAAIIRHINYHTQVEIAGNNECRAGWWDRNKSEKHSTQAFKKNETLKNDTVKLWRGNTRAIFCNHCRRWAAQFWYMTCYCLRNSYQYLQCKVAKRQTDQSFPTNITFKFSTGFLKKDSWAPHVSFPRSWELVLFWLIT